MIKTATSATMSNKPSIPANASLRSALKPGGSGDYTGATSGAPSLSSSDSTDTTSDVSTSELIGIKACTATPSSDGIGGDTSSSTPSISTTPSSTSSILL